MRFRCPSCQGLFDLDALPQSGRTECPTCGKPVRVGTPPAAPVPVRPVAPDPDFAAIPSITFQPQTLPAYLTQPPPRRESKPKNPWDEPPRRQKKSSGGNVVLWIAMISVGGFLALGLLGFIGFLVVNGGGFLSTEMSIAGYSAKAPGRLASKNSSMTNDEVGILNPGTGSQFQLIFVRNSGLRVATPETFIEGLRGMSSSLTSKPVTRLGMNGIAFDAKNAVNSADAEGEVFPISGGALIVLYQPGSSLAGGKGRDVKYTGERERSLDKVDAFFESLAKK